MSEYKTIVQWFDEIGLVAGMVFESKSNKPFILTIDKFKDDNVYWVNYLADDSGDQTIWHYSKFTSVYKLIFDPRSENKSEKETVEKSFKDILWENTQKLIDKENEAKENEYKQFSETMKKTLLEISLKCKTFYHVCASKLAERFCAENGLKYEYIPGRGTGYHHKISWE